MLFLMFSFMLPHSAPSWILSSAENLASFSLQDGARIGTIIIGPASQPATQPPSQPASHPATYFDLCGVPPPNYWCVVSPPKYSCVLCIIATFNSILWVQLSFLLNLCLRVWHSQLSLYTKFCQAQPRPQLKWAEISLIFNFSPPDHLLTVFFSLA